MSFGSNLRKARKEKSLTQKELAASIGVKHNSISNWENDQNKPDPDTIELLCGVLDITPNILFGTTASGELSRSARRVARAYDIAPEPAQRIVDVTLDPYMDKPAPARMKLSHTDKETSTHITPHRKRLRLPLPMQSLSAGIGEPDNGDYADMVEATLDIGARKADYLMRVTGDSMEPDYPDDCIVAIEAVDDIEFGAVGVYSVDGDFYIKIKGREGLESINPKYPVIRITADNGVRCCGRVVGIASDVEYI